MKTLESTLEQIDSLVGFVEIPGYDGRYMINESGDILRIYKNGNKIILKQNETNKGYMRVQLHLNNKTKTYKVHQLLAMTFLNHIPCGMYKVVHHLDGNKKNNQVKNLKIVGTRENTLISTSPKYLKGAYYNKLKNQWYSRIQINGKDKYLGTFNTKEQANMAYKKAYDELVK